MNYPQVSKVKLLNGSALIHLLLPYSTSNAIAAFVKAGSRFDPEQLPGLSHFMEHMTLGGTKIYPTSEELHTALEKHGSWYEAFTYADYVYYTIKFAGDCLETMTENLAERLLNSLFKKKDIEETRGNILQELYLNKTNPERYIWDLWQETIWQETRVSRNYLGTKECLSKINRDNLIDFYQNHYGFNHSIFFYAGHQEVEKVVKLFSVYFKNFTRFSKTALPEIKPQRKNPLKIHHSSDEQITFAFGFKTEGLLNPDHSILELLQVILGLGWSSRLGKKLFLENGLIYEWLMNYHQLFDYGYLMFQSASLKEHFNKVLYIIIKELSDIKHNGINKNELQKAKNYYQGNLLVNTETPLDFIHWYGRQELFLPKQVIGLKEKIQLIKRVSADDIRRVVQKYCTDNNWFLSAIGDIRKNEIKIPTF